MRNVYINDTGEHNINAAFKARDDVTNIVKKINGFKILDFKNVKNGKVAFFTERVPTFINTIFKIKSEDNIYFNYPLGRVYLKYLSFLKNSKKVKLIPIIHDLDSLRGTEDMDDSFLTVCDKIICHNIKMKEYLSSYLSIPNGKMVTLDIFDYLYHKNIQSHVAGDGSEIDSVIFTGNLSPQKSGFIYQDIQGIKLDLWGGGYEAGSTGGNYVGRFDSSDPSGLSQHYHSKNILGLIWDGPVVDSCKGPFGEYLKFNNPHKTSFYLSLGIPVVIWSQAAMADFVKANNCGICLDSLSQLGQLLATDINYQGLKSNAEAISKRLNSGYYLSNAIAATAKD